MDRRWHPRRRVVATAAAVLALVACSDESPDSAGIDTTETSVAASTDNAEQSAATELSPEGADATDTPDGTEVGASSSGESVGDWFVVDVTDGDTIDVEGPSGFDEVRIIGINTPETGECLYDEATDALAAMVDGSYVELVADQTDHDQYGRLLRYVEVGGIDAGAEMVATGHALARRYEPDVARADEYAALQSAAQEAGLGVWSSEACGAAVGGVDITIVVEADAPGDDNDNLNGEWVEITNESADEVDLDDWELADESASHRYRFEDVVIPAGETLIVFTGCGRDRDLRRYWCSTGSAVWNNSGDTAFLRDPSGNNVAFQPYGDSA